MVFFFHYKPLYRLWLETFIGYFFSIKLEGNQKWRWGTKPLAKLIKL